MLTLLDILVMSEGWLFLSMAPLLDAVVMSEDWLFFSVDLFSALVLALVTMSINLSSFSLSSSLMPYVWY